MYDFAKKYGYGLHIQREKIVQDMHINWTKIALLQNAVHQGDGFSCLIDADTIVINKNFSFEEWTKKLSGALGILMTKDTPLFQRNRPNAGLILVDHAKGGVIMDDWMSAARNEGSHLADTHPRNQLVYWNYVQPKHQDRQVMVSNAYAAKYHWFMPYIPSGKRFLFHFTQTEQQGRTSSMRKIYFKYWKNSETLDMIKGKLDEQREGLLTLC